LPAGQLIELALLALGDPLLSFTELGGHAAFGRGLRDPQ
jgi:hypothetical protein